MALISNGSFSDFSMSLRPDGGASFARLKTLGAVSEVTRRAQGLPVQFTASRGKRGLALKSLTLEEGFEGFLGNLFGDENQVYFLSWAWDLSGQPPFEHPGAGADPKSVLIPMKVGKAREFLGDGVLLFPARKVTAGLAVRIMLWESDQDARDFGKTLEKVSNAVKSSKLTNLLALVSAATGVAGATVSMVAAASAELAGAVGGILQATSDDYVDYYEGYYSSESAWTAGEEHHNGVATKLVLTRIAD